MRCTFLRDKLLGTLNASNPFEWADTDITLYGAREMRTDKHNPRSFYAHLVYRFNTAQSINESIGDFLQQKLKISAAETENFCSRN